MAVPEKSGTAFSSHKFCEAVRFWPVGLVKPSRSFGSSAIVRESSSWWGKAVREVYCATCWQHQQIRSSNGGGEVDD